MSDAASTLYLTSGREKTPNDGDYYEAVVRVRMQTYASERYRERDLRCVAERAVNAAANAYNLVRARRAAAEVGVSIPRSSRESARACQAYSRLAARHPEREYPDLIAPAREALQEMGKPYVIENVPEAPLIDPVILMGGVFDLGTPSYRLVRRRAFETSWASLRSPSVSYLAIHDGRPSISVVGHAGRAGRNNSGTSAERREAMEIPWLPSEALSEAIPPAYTEWIGARLLAYLDTLEVAA